MLASVHGLEFRGRVCVCVHISECVYVYITELVCLCVYVRSELVRVHE